MFHLKLGQTKIVAAFELLKKLEYPFEEAQALIDAAIKAVEEGKIDAALKDKLKKKIAKYWSWSRYPTGSSHPDQFPRKEVPELEHYVGKAIGENDIPKFLETCEKWAAWEKKTGREYPKRRAILSVMSSSNSF